MMNVSEAIRHCEDKTKELRCKADNINLHPAESYTDCLECAEEHEQLAEWLKELKGLRLLLDWAVECGFGYDNIPEEYQKYKNDIESKELGYTEGLIYIAKCEAELNDK